MTARMKGMRYTHRITFGKSEEKLPFGNPTNGWENNITTGLK